MQPSCITCEGARIWVAGNMGRSPSWCSWSDEEQTHQFQLPFALPFGIAALRDRIFMSDSYNERVHVFRPDGTRVRCWGESGRGPGQFRAIRGLCVNQEDLYVCDAANYRVQVFGLDGTFVRSWRVNRHVQGIAVIDEECFVLNARHLEVHARDGTYLRDLSGFHGPELIQLAVLDSGKLVFLTERDVQTCQPDGANRQTVLPCSYLSCPKRARKGFEGREFALAVQAPQTVLLASAQPVEGIGGFALRSKVLT